MKRKSIFLITTVILISFLSCTDPTDPGTDPGTEPEVIYTVSFELNGGSAITDQSVIAGGFVTAPSTPTKSGFELSGWFTDVSLTTQWDFASDTVTTDMTLYAGWNDLFIDSFSTNGFTVWNSAADVQDIGYDIAVDSDGNVFVTGYSTEGVSSSTENDMTIWKFNRSGILDTDFNTDGTVFFDGGHGAPYDDDNGADSGSAYVVQYR